jgi:hypothetical protein
MQLDILFNYISFQSQKTKHDTQSKDNYINMQLISTFHPFDVAWFFANECTIQMCNHK